METFEEDARYIFLKANLDLPLKRASKRADHGTRDHDNTKEVRNDPRSPEARTMTYFKQLNSSTIQALYECYKLDFELFGYNLKGLI